MGGGGLRAETSAPNRLTGSRPGGSTRQPSSRWRVLALVVCGVVLLSTCSVPTGRRDARPSTGYAVRCLAVGAAVTIPGKPWGAGVDAFERLQGQLGPLTMRRSFDPTLPRTFAASAAGGDPAAGLHTFVSWKPPNGDFRGATAGRYDREIAAWARSVPRTGVFATAFHEPENDMTAAQYVAFARHMYTVVKAANPTIQWGPVYMAYWWDPAQPAHYVGDPAAWWPGKEYADFVAVDWYGFDPSPMTSSASFANWYRTFQPTGLPLLIAEYGQYFQPTGRAPDPAKEQARASAIGQDAAWIAHHPQIKAWLYWQGEDSSATGQWDMQDAVSQQAWQSVARSGCRG